MHTKDIKLLAITGGPCSGKSELLEHLRSEEIGQRALFVPEAATMVLPGFLAVRSETDSRDSEWQLHLQRSVSRLQMSLEEAYISAAQNAGKEIVVCDRGIIDAEVYTDAAQMVYEEIGFTAEQLIMRYHGVIHMESLATSSPDTFSAQSNPYRYEDCHSAAQIEMRTRQVWAGHPKWRFIPGEDDIATKLANATSVLQQLNDVT